MTVADNPSVFSLMGVHLWELIAVLSYQQNVFNYFIRVIPNLTQFEHF